MASVVKIDSLVVEKKSKMLQVYRPMDKRMLDKSSHKPSAHLSYKTLGTEFNPNDKCI